MTVESWFRDANSNAQWKDKMDGRRWMLFSYKKYLSRYVSTVLPLPFGEVPIIKAEVNGFANKLF